MDLANRTIHNALYNSMSWFVPIIITYFVFPYIVNNLGADRYGILVLINSIVGYLAVFDLGLQNALVKYVSEYYTNSDNKKVSHVIGTTIVIFTCLGIIASSSLILVSKNIITHFLKIPDQHIPSTIVAFHIAAFGFISTLFLSLFIGIIQGLNRYDISSKMTIIGFSLTSVLSAFILFLGYGLAEVVIVQVTITLINVIGYIFIIKHLFPKVKLKPVFNISILLMVLKFGAFSLMSRISYLIIYNIDKIIVGAMLGVFWVTFYAVPFKLIHHITSVTVRISSVIFPIASEFQSKKQIDYLKDLNIKASRLMFLISSAISIPIIFFGPRLLSLWMGEEYRQKGELVLILLTLGIYFNSITNVPTFIVDGIGQPKISGISGAITSFLFVAICIPCTKLWGINGTALAFFISNMVVGIGFVWYVNSRILKIYFWELLNVVYIKLAVLTGIFALILAFLPIDLISSLFLLLLIMVLSITIFSLVALLGGGLPTTDRVLILNYLRTRLI